jgi:hypothetical protein
MGRNGNANVTVDSSSPAGALLLNEEKSLNVKNAGNKDEEVLILLEENLVDGPFLEDLSISGIELLGIVVVIVEKKDT